MMEFVAHLVKSVQHLLFPPICVGCSDETVENQAQFCATCLSKFPYANNLHEANNAFEKHFLGRVRIEAGGCLCYFSKGGVVQHALHQLKYKNQPQIGFALGRMLGRSMLTSGRFDQVDVVMPVPMHPHKRAKRGYNQAEWIAKGVSLVLHIPCRTECLVRAVNNPTQTRKTRISRMHNVGRSFDLIQTDGLSGAHILLIDDVLTSGATLDFCGQAIRQKIPCRLSMATVAMGNPV